MFKQMPQVSLFLMATLCAQANAQSTPPDRASKVPQYSFPVTLAEQEAELKRNPLLQRFHESRQKMADDPHRPVYHYVSPEGRMNDPNGLCFWQGRWHLFYQASLPEDPRSHWGHVVSDDLIHWRDLPLAIYPDPEEQCYSGSTFVEEDRVIAMYFGVGAGTMAAVSDDPLLLNWKKVTGHAVMPFPKRGERPLYRYGDTCIWKHDGMYYALTAGAVPEGPGGKHIRTEDLHRSKDLMNWEYLHPFLENDQYGLIGDDGSCPYFWPIDDKHILLHFSHMSGGKYIIGDYDTQRHKFVVTDGGDFNFGSYAPSGVHAPSAFPDDEDGVIVIFNMNEGKPTKGWSRVMTLPRRLRLRPEGFFNPLYVEPAGDIESLRGEHMEVAPMKLPANQEVVLEDVRGDAMEIVAEIAPQVGQTVELNVLRSPDGEEVTRVQFFRDRGFRRKPLPLRCVASIDTSRSSLAEDVSCRPPEMAQVELSPDEPLEVRVFVDRSVVEVFVNGKQCLAVRVYPERRDSVGISLEARGRDAELTSLDAWQMKSIYENRANY